MQFATTTLLAAALLAAWLCERAVHGAKTPTLHRPLAMEKIEKKHAGSSASCRTFNVGAGDSCTDPFSALQMLLRQTQFSVGYGWVQGEVEAHFDSAKHAEKEMAGEPIPVVIGPSSRAGFPAYYILDHHHHLAALMYSGYTDTDIILDIVCDRRELSQEDFWDFMSQNAFVYTLARDSPEALPTERSASSLPAYFSFVPGNMTFVDDPWRSLGSFVRKVKNDTCSDSDYCMRCYNRICSPSDSSVPFFEFKWGYFFNSMYLDPTNYWAGSSQSWSAWHSAFLQVMSQGMGSFNTKDWEDLAAALIPTCRADSTGGFQLPASLFKNGGNLPGYVEGWTPIPDDPDCDSPQCPS